MTDNPIIAIKEINVWEHLTHAEWLDHYEYFQQITDKTNELVKASNRHEREIRELKEEK